MLGIALITFFIAVFVLDDSSEYKEQKLSFAFESEQLSATLILPKNHTPPHPTAVFVHGDGALPYDAYGYYRPFWNHLAKRGIASFAWDKAGVGSSSGNWLSQSMEERAEEVIAAIDYLQQHDDIKPDSIGLIGFSQAGWVLPLVAQKSAYPDFMVNVSGAVNWLDQGDYMMRVRLREKDLSEVAIQQAIEENRERLWVFESDSSYEDYLTAHGASEDEPMSEDRYQFAKRNWQLDSRESIESIRSPFLAVFGEDDRNVDVAESARVYRDILTTSQHPDVTIKTWENAQHGLLKPHLFDTANPGIIYLVKLHMLGEDAFADGVLAFVSDWILDRVTGHLRTS